MNISKGLSETFETIENIIPQAIMLGGSCLGEYKGYYIMDNIPSEI